MKRKGSMIFLIICIVFDVLSALFFGLMLITDMEYGNSSTHPWFIALTIAPIACLLTTVLFLIMCVKGKRNTGALSLIARLSMMSIVLGSSYFFVPDGTSAAVGLVVLGIVIGVVVILIMKQTTQKKIMPQQIGFYGYNGAIVWLDAAVEYLRLNKRDISELKAENPKPVYRTINDFLETDFAGLTDDDKEKITEYACTPIIYLLQWVVEKGFTGENFQKRYNPENVENLMKGFIPVSRFFRTDMHYIMDNNDINKEGRRFLMWYYGRFFWAKKCSRDDYSYLYDYCDLVQSKGAYFFCVDYHYDIYEEFKGIFDKRYEYFKEMLEYYKEEKFKPSKAAVKWQKFGKNLKVYTYAENTEAQLEKCCEMLNNLSEKEYSRLKRRVNSFYGTDNPQLDFEKMFSPTTVCIFKPKDDDVYCYVSGDAEFDEEHGFGFAILNGIIVGIGDNADYDTPYSKASRNMYELMNNDIDFLSLTAQKRVDELVEKGELVAVAMDFEEFIATETNEENKTIYITPAAEKILREDIHRIKMICKCGMISQVSITCRKEKDILVPAVIHARGYVVTKENVEKKSICRYSDSINVWY